MAEAIQYVVNICDAQLWDSAARKEFLKALARFLQVAIDAMNADETMEPQAKEFQTRNLSCVRRQVIATTDANSPLIDLADNVRRDKSLVTLLDFCVRCAFEESQRLVGNASQLPANRLGDEMHFANVRQSVMDIVRASSTN